MNQNFAIVCVVLIACATVVGLIWVGAHYSLKLRELSLDEDRGDDSSDDSSVWESTTACTVHPDSCTHSPADLSASSTEGPPQ